MADVIIVGAGPAGSTLALLLARSGARVLLAERARFPRRKPCAEYLSPGSVCLLRQIGAGPRLDALGGAPVRGFTLYAHSGAAMYGEFGRAPRWGDAPDRGLGLARDRLDTELAGMAAAAGADLREGTRVVAVVRDGRRVTGVRVATARGMETWTAPVTVGADGVTGVVGRRLGMTGARPRLRRAGLVAHVSGIDGVDGRGEMHVATGGYCGVAPLGSGVANVAMVLHAERAAHIAGDVPGFFNAEMRRFPALAIRLGRARIEGAVLRTGPMCYPVRSMTGDGVLLAGDAGGFYDPFTGQGVFHALRSAQLAAPVIHAALEHGPVRTFLAPYERARRRAFRAGHAVEWLIQRFLAVPPLFDRAVVRLGARPDMADTLVAVTGDVLPAARVLTPRFLARLVR